jgi:hypothetical protein
MIKQHSFVGPAKWGVACDSVLEVETEENVFPLIWGVEKWDCICSLFW